jgi:uncharacterized alkaline shock family protein YloU
MDEVQGKVTIAPAVLTTIVRQTALEEGGVSRLAPVPPKVRGLLAGGATEEGIFIAVTEQGVQVELHVVADAQSNMLKLGSALQTSITRALEEMVGMPVMSIDVYIDDVAVPATKTA